MASSGIHRKIDDLGRVVIPVGIRRNLGISEGDELEVTVEGDRVILAKPNDRCMLCSSDRDLLAVRGRKVCGDCADDLAVARGRATEDQVVVLDEPVAPKSKNAW